MNRRTFFAAAGGSVLGLGAVSLNSDTKVSIKGPYSIEIVSPPIHTARELPLFDSYKQAENFAQARMNLLRQSAKYDSSHAAGSIKIWSHGTGSGQQLVFECTWSETCTIQISYVDADGRLA